MHIALWAMAGVLAVVFLAAGGMKLTQPKQRLVEAGMASLVKLPDGLVKTLGALEVAGAIGVVGPPLVGIATVLVPLAAVGLALIMLGAVAVHAARKEFDRVSVPVALLVMAAVVAWGRFGPYAFSG